MRDSFVCYRSFRDAIKALPEEEQLSCYEALFDYALDGIEPEAKGAALMFFLLVKPQIDANTKRYSNGAKGGRPKETKPKPSNNQTETKQKPNHNQTVTKAEPNVNVNVNDNENDNGNENVSVNENVSLSDNGAVNAASERERIPPLQKSFPVLSAFKRFRDLREQLGRPVTDDNEGLLWDRLSELSKDDEQTAIAILNQAIEGGYYTLAPVKAKKESNSYKEQNRTDLAEIIELAKEREARV